ncbi:MAG: hypothetical protein Q3972_04715 [Corynebacterium sp.]|nr:hypothetical protein [Corynebacterium sp.]
MRPEALLRVADEFCAARRTHIRSFPAIVALAALFDASIHGVPLYRNATEKASHIRSATQDLRPLAQHNDDFGRMLAALATTLSSERFL